MVDPDLGYSKLLEKILLSWSSGKDSAWALHLLAGRNVVGLITSFNTQASRVAMHGVRRELAEAQAKRAGLPLWNVELPWPCSNTDYEERMRALCDQALIAGVTHIAFGDLFLEDIRAYREKQLQLTGLQPLFPVWKLPTHELAREMIRAGLRAKIACGDFDEGLLGELPAQVDPCGENGEFHTFVYDSPGWTSAIAVQKGEIVDRDGFIYADFFLEQAA
jgi:diphthamide synthase (EF-2-diphthine--ammonia ligase)